MSTFTLLLLSSFLSLGSSNTSDKKTTSNSPTLTETSVITTKLDASIKSDSANGNNINQAGSIVNEKTTNALAYQMPDHKIFNDLLKTYVSAVGIVNYKGLKTKEAELDKYLAELGKETPTNKWNRNASLAYWLNAYNAFTLKLILKNYPVKSIQDINTGKPWDLKWIKLGDKTYTLNDIENTIIRPTYKDPRIHFALVCAAKSCPPLLNEAFTEANVEGLLEQRAKKFINSSANDISANKIALVKIFDWYKEDFGNVIGFLNKYSNTKINAGAAVSFKEYDWSLNGK